MQCRLTLYISLGIIRRYFTTQHNLTVHPTLTRTDGISELIYHLPNDRDD